MIRTELHRHLDASFRPSTLSNLVNRFRIATNFKNEEELKKNFWVSRQMDSLKEVLDCFVLFQKVLQTEEIFKLIAIEAIEDVAVENTASVELRYSPSFASELSPVSWQNGLNAFLAGLSVATKNTNVNAGLICIVSRDYGAEMAMKTIDFAIENRKHFIGVDLAGNEAHFPNSLFKSAFQKAKNAGFNITIHAGEADGPNSVWSAIDDLGAKRIGHGVNAIHDKTLLKRLAKDKILIESCPTSNYVTHAVKTLKEHPLLEFLNSGIPVSISTDDPGIFGVSLPEEYQRAKRYLGLSDDDLKRIDQYSNDYSFLK